MKKSPSLFIEGFFFTLIMMLATVQSSAQSDTISAVVLNDAESLVKDFFLAGNCIDVFNFELSGESGQAGVFSNGMTTIGIESGIVLSTGNVLDISGPNNDPETSTLYGNLGNDTDLETLDTIFTGNPSPRTLSDIVILEFDFTPTVEQASFEFVFASEEYCFYSLTSFIDIFGFFVSGPGLNGPYENDGVNIALVPNTDIPITAFSINDFMNQEYYVNNTLPVSPDNICTITPPAAPDFIEFDGYTKPLIASFQVIPCETYHIKLAITDTSDDILDSAVFLKAQSFVAGRTSAISSSIMGQSAGENAPYEGCGNAEIIFSRGDMVDTNDLVVHYEILETSTATPGVDFTLLPDSIIIPAGVSSDTFLLDFFADDINEGNEIFTIKLRNPCSCAESELTISIVDPLPLSGIIEGVDEICIDDGLELIATPSGGFGNIHYIWPNNDMDSIYNVVPITSMNHQLIISDDCLQTDTIDFPVNVLSPETFIDGSGVICDGLPDFSYFVELIGGDSFSFDILQGGEITSYSDINVDTFWIQATETGVFQVINAFADGCEADVSGFAQALLVDITTQVTIDSIDCFEVFDASAFVTPNGGDGAYSYSWSHDALLTQDTAFNLGIGNYDVFINDTQGCLDTISFALDQPELFSIEIDTLQLEADCNLGGALLASGSGGVTPYAFNWSNGPTTALNEDLLPNTYSVTVTDVNDCVEELEVDILDNGDLPFIELFVDTVLNCLTSTVNITTGNSSVGAEFIYTWTNSLGDTLLPANPQNWNTTIPDIYTLEIKDETSDCFVSMNIEVVEDILPPPTTILASLLNIDCYQPSSNLSAEQVSHEWLAEWFDVDADTLIAFNQWNIDVFSSGNYELHVTDTINGCENRDTIRINQLLDGPTAEILMPDSLDCDASEVDLIVDISNGSGNYTYQWTGPTNGINGATDEASAVATLAGDYQLVLFDAFNGCTSTLTTNVVIDVSSLVLDPIPDTTLTCLVDEINLTANSPTAGNLQYTWLDNEGEEVSNSPDISIQTAGDYSVVVLDVDNNCTQMMTIAVDSNTVEPSIVTNPHDDLDCITTSANLSAIPSMNEQAIWLNSTGDTLAQNTWTYSTTESGTYQILVTNNDNGCFSFEDIDVLIDTITPQGTIPLPDSLTCTENTVPLTVETPIGATDYAFNWAGPVDGLTGPVNQENATASLAGDYQLILTDNTNGCNDTLMINVAADTTLLMIDPLPDTTLTCLVEEITLTANSPTSGNLQYTWLDSSGMELSSTPTVTINAIGTYTVEVIDLDNGCMQSSSLEVDSDYTEPVISINAPDSIDCTNTSVVLSATPGVDEYAIWLNAAGDTLAQDSWNYTTSDAGAYQLFVINNSSGCFSFEDIMVEIDTISPQATILGTTELTCEEDEVSLEANIINSSGDYGYEWSGPTGGINGPTNENMVSVDNIGTYTLILTDFSNGCSNEFMVEITENGDFPIINPLQDTMINCFDPTLFIEATSPTIGDLSYQWLNEEETIISSVASLTITEGGIYEIQLIDNDNDCVSRLSIAVDDDFVMPNVDAGLDAEINCNNDSALLSGIEGNTNWTPSWFDENNVLLSVDEWMYNTAIPGSYQLSVIDNQNGCIGSDIAIVTSNLSPPNADAGEDVIIDCFSNLAMIDASSSTLGSNITYALFDEFGVEIQNGSSTSFSVNQTGTYQLIVTDNDNHCTDEDDVIVGTEAPEITTINSINAFCFGQEGSLVIEDVTGGASPYLYSIDNGESYQLSNVFNGLTSGSYQVLVQDINGCTGEATGTIQEPQGTQIVLPEIIELSVGDSIILTPLLDTIGLVSIEWSLSDQLSCQKCLNPQFNASESQLLELTVVDENGCETSRQVLIIVDQRVPVYIPNAFSPHNEDGTNDLFVIYGDDSQLVEIESLNIFNRWGDLVFTAKNFPANDPQFGWDGRWNGEKLNANVFVYSTEIVLITGEKIHLKGEILLLD